MDPLALVPAAWLQCGLHLPPLLPQGHHLSQRDGWHDGLPVEERPGESPSLPPSPFSVALLWFFPRLVTTCAASPALCAAADRLRRLLQDAERPNWSRASAVHPLRAQDSSDTGTAVPSNTFFHSTEGKKRAIRGCLCLTNLLFSWTAGDEARQSAALQPDGLQQRRSDSPGVDGKRVNPLCKLLLPFLSEIFSSSEMMTV